MTRLVTFGDSFTYGHGLVDCFIPPDRAPDTPSKLAWPQVLGDMLGIEVINKSSPGNSNVQILRDILNFEILPTDLVIVGWTYSLRDCIFKKNIFGVKSEFRLNVWHKDTKFIKKFFEVHNDYDLAVKAGLYVHHVESYLKTKNIKQFHFFAMHGWFEVMPVFTIEPENFIHKEIIQHKLDRALDNSHPGPLSHQQAAEKLYEIINESK
jgi:hypothetical protein